MKYRSNAYFGCTGVLISFVYFSFRNKLRNLVSSWFASSATFVTQLSSIDLLFKVYLFPVSFNYEHFCHQLYCTRLGVCIKYLDLKTIGYLIWSWSEIKSVYDIWLLGSKLSTFSNLWTSSVFIVIPHLWSLKAG